jgi:hypothetical protein
MFGGGIVHHRDPGIQDLETYLLGTRCDGHRSERALSFDTGLVMKRIFELASSLLLATCRATAVDKDRTV